MPKVMRKRRRQRTRRQRQKQIPDKIHREIMNYVRLHPHATVAEIGKKKEGKKLSRSATQQRLKPLLKAGCLRRGMTVDLGALGYPLRYKVAIRINPRVLQDDNKDIPKSGVGTRWGTTNSQKMLAHYVMDKVTADGVIVEDVSILLGDPADLSATVSVDDPDRIFRYVTEEIRTIVGIENTSTCYEAWSCFREQNRVLAEEEKVAAAAQKPRKRASRSSTGEFTGPASKDSKKG